MRKLINNKTVRYILFIMYGTLLFTPAFICGIIGMFGVFISAPLTWLIKPNWILSKNEAWIEVAPITSFFWKLYIKYSNRFLLKQFQIIDIEQSNVLENKESVMDRLTDINNSLDNIYLFKVKDFTTILLGRYDKENNCYYVQRGDGVKYEYQEYRITWKQKLNCYYLNFDINRSDFYEYGKPELKERTKKRLIEIAEFGMKEVGIAEFGYKEIMSGLYIEMVWHYSDEDFKDYMDWVKGLIANKLKNK